MRRRVFLIGLPWIAAVAAPVASTTIRGKLITGAKPLLVTLDHGSLSVTGDEPTTGVLRDQRLRDVDFEAVGTLENGILRIDPIHTKAMFVHRDGKRLLISYWCDVCYIRTYTPGICWCCQKETDLDLRESITD